VPSITDSNRCPSSMVNKSARARSGEYGGWGRASSHVVCENNEPEGTPGPDCCQDGAKPFFHS